MLKVSLQLLSFLSVLLSTFSTAAHSEILVAAAADLSPLASFLQSANRSSQIRFSFGASGSLRQQIENGAPFDVFLSANAGYIEDLSRSGKVKPNTVVEYARGRLGLYSKDGRFRDLRDLSTAVRVAIPNPALAPYGFAARELLEQKGIWSGLQPRIVLGENVLQAFQYAETGNVDAAITSWTLVLNKGGVLLPPDHAPIRQLGAVVSTSAHAAEAEAFLQWLTGPEGARVLRKQGLEVPSPGMRKR